MTIYFPLGYIFRLEWLFVAADNI